MYLSAVKDAKILFFKAKKPGLGAVMGDMFGDAPLADMPIMHRGHATKTGGYVAPFVEHHKVRLAASVQVAPPVQPVQVATPTHPASPIQAEPPPPALPAAEFG
jgi:hypothetical protein